MILQIEPRSVLCGSEECKLHFKLKIGKYIPKIVPLADNVKKVYIDVKKVYIAQKRKRKQKKKQKNRKKKERRKSDIKRIKK